MVELEIGAELDVNRDTLAAPDPRSRADFRSAALVVRTMLTMLAAISGARRAARSAAGECVHMIGLRILGFGLAAVLALGLSVGQAGARSRPVVVELFTSQSCYSCPTAEAFLGKLAREPDIVALEFHVDYWNDINYGSAGQWTDPFSRPAFTRRQRDYNQQIRDQSGVYTPQMVIDGRFEKSGNSEWAVEAAIRSARGEDEPGVIVAVRRVDANGLSIAVDGAAKSAAVTSPAARRRQTRTRSDN